MASQRSEPFLHLAVGHAQVAERQPQFLQAGLGVLGRTADLGLADDLHQGDARAVEIDLGEPAAAVRELAGILFQVNARQAAALPPPPSLRTGISSHPPVLNGRSYWLIW